MQAKKSSLLLSKVLLLGLWQSLCYQALCSPTKKSVEKYHIDLIQYAYHWFGNKEEITSAKLCRCQADKHRWGLSVCKSRTRTFSKLSLYKKCVSTVKHWAMHQGEKMSPLSRESGSAAGKPETRKELERIIMDEQHSMSSQCYQGIKRAQGKERRGCLTSFHTQWEAQLWKWHLFKKLSQSWARLPEKNRIPIWGWKEIYSKKCQDQSLLLRTRLTITAPKNFHREKKHRAKKLSLVEQGIAHQWYKAEAYKSSQILGSHFNTENF